MATRTRKKQVVWLSQAAAGLVVCATVSLGSVSIGMARTQTPSVSSVSKRVPVTAGAWHPISVEGMWSADPAKGWLRFRVGNQVSGKFTGANLLRNTQNESTVPSYLEMGPYQSSSLPGFSLSFSDLSVYG
jgi:hypothetical protein